MFISDPVRLSSLTETVVFKKRRAINSEANALVVFVLRFLRTSCLDN